jgi:hypothetical protein
VKFFVIVAGIFLLFNVGLLAFGYLRYRRHGFEREQARIRESIRNGELQ